MPSLRLGARWLVPVTSPSIEDGAVLVGADGRIAVARRAARCRVESAG